MKAYLIGAIILAAAIASVLVFLPVNPALAEPITFAIEPGEGSRDIGYRLERQGLIHSGPFFRLYVLTTGSAGNLQAGTYELNPSMSLYEIERKIALGDVLKETITVIEGWNLRDIGFAFENKGMFQAEELWELAGFPGADYRKAGDLPLPHNFAKEFSSLKSKPAFVGLEGYLFPDTYQITKGEELGNIVRRMLANFETKIQPFEQELASQEKSLFEVLTIASLLEKEVQTLQDKKMVASVLQKRLDIGMPFQVDATVSYLTDKKTTRISIQDTQIDSPYNTYKYPGLPLGPIANPGKESIEAALFPIKNPYFYYLSTPEGETIFSKTLKEHNAAKAMYLR